MKTVVLTGATRGPGRKMAIEGLSQPKSQELPEGMAVVALNPGIINQHRHASLFVAFRRLGVSRAGRAVEAGGSLSSLNWVQRTTDAR